MAQNGWLAYQLSWDLEHLRLFDFLSHLADHDLWPPGYSLLLMPWVGFGGGSFASAILFQTVCYATVPLLLALLACRISPGNTGAAAAILAVLLWTASPIAGLYSLLTMREIPGVVFTLLAMLTYSTAVRAGTLRAWRTCAFAALALISIKYNYGLAWVAAAALDRVSAMSTSERRDLLRELVLLLIPWKARSRAWAAVASILWLLAVLHLAGIGISGGLWGLMVILTVAGLRWAWLQRASLGIWLAAMPPPGRAALEFLALPLWLWFLLPSPSHLRSALAFLENRSSELTWSEHLVFYPRAFAETFVPDPAMGSLVLLVAAAGAVLGLRDATPAWRMSALFAIVMTALAIVHGYKIDRFLLTVSPLYFVLAAVAVVHLLTTILPSAVRGFALLSTCALAFVAWMGVVEEKVIPWAVDQADAIAGPPGILEAAHQLAAWSVNREVVGLVGGSNELNPHLIRWIALRDHPGSAELIEPPRRVADRAVQWADEHDLRSVVGFELSASSPLRNQDFESFNAWKGDFLSQLGSAAGWHAVDERLDEELGLRMIELERQDG